MEPIDIHRHNSNLITMLKRYADFSSNHCIVLRKVFLGGSTINAKIALEVPVPLTLIAVEFRAWKIILNTENKPRV